MRELCKQVIGIVGSVVLAASPASATNTREPLNFTFTPDGHYSSFSGTTAHEMMPTPEFQDYMQALKNMKCEIAGDILNSAFIRQYPRFERARRKQNNKYDLDYNAWRMYAEGFFDEFGYCVIMSDMDRIEKLLRKAKAKPAKYAMQRR